jgi:4-amino-4-deoxy-L-arabinose transferase-like glycosyltransferase
MKSSDRTLLWAVLALAAALRLLIFLAACQHPERTLTPDSHSYLQAAWQWLATGQYPPTAYRTPVYPLFLSFIFGVAGPSLQAVVAMQSLLGVLNVWLAWELGRRLLTPQAAIAGAMLLAISPEGFAGGFYILTETLFTFLLLTSLLFLIKACQTGAKSSFAISAALMATAALCRPIALLLPVCIVGILFAAPNLRWFEAIKRSLIYALVFAAVLAPWVFRNWTSLGAPVFSTTGSDLLLRYHSAALIASRQGVAEAQSRAELESRVRESLAREKLPDTEINRARVQSRLALQILGRHPLEYTALHLKRCLNNFLPYLAPLFEITGQTTGGRGTLSVLNNQGLKAAIRHYFGDKTWLIGIAGPLLILLAAIYMAAAVSVVNLARHKAWFVLAVLLLPTLFLLLLPGSASEPRFRLPIMPLLCLLAAPSILNVWNTITLKNSAPSQPEKVQVENRNFGN